MGNKNKGNDDLSATEKAEIGNQLGLSGDIVRGDDAYLLLKVPDFGDTSFVNTTAPAAASASDFVDGSVADPNVLQSFLRLGAFKYDDEPPAARELLKMIPKGNCASNPSLPDQTTTILPGITGAVFVDDARQRPQDIGLTVADDPDHKLTAAERVAESAKLYSRGGWRDHSDGNRISTTWGDKVEVVRGNYKMIVMGRQNDPGLSMGWEATGAHIQDWAPGTMPGASYWLEWINDPRYHATGAGGDGRKGVWLLANTTENVYEYARNAGNFREEQWGDVIETYVGSENPPSTGAFATDAAQGTLGHEPPHRIAGRSYDRPGAAGNTARATPPWALDNQGMVRSNPHIIEKTWAERIDSWTGSEAKPVPKIREKTFADDINSRTGSATQRVNRIDDKTYANETEELSDVLRSVTSRTTVGGAVTEATTVGGALTATTTVGGASTDVTTVGVLIAEQTAAPMMFSASEALIAAEGSLYGLHLEINESALHFAFEHHAILDFVFHMAPYTMDIHVGRGQEVGMSLADNRVEYKQMVVRKGATVLMENQTGVSKTVKALKLAFGV